MSFTVVSDICTICSRSQSTIDLCERQLSTVRNNGNVVIIGDVNPGAEILAKGEGKTKKDAEQDSAIKACKKLGAWRLEDCDMYVTLEPCFMCAGAIINARIKNLWIGAMDPKAGAAGSKFNLFEGVKLNHTVTVFYHVREEECQKILHPIHQV